MEASKIQSYPIMVLNDEGIIQAYLRRNNFQACTKALSKEDKNVS